MDRVTIEQAAHILGIEEESNSELRDRLEEARSIDDEEQRIMDEFETASEEEKRVLLFKARELQERRKMVVEKVALLIEESEDSHAASGAPDSRVDERLEHVRIAALETEKKLFEMRKLVATLAIGTIVAIYAVTPALLPKLNNPEGLWPAFAWLLISVAGSIILCVYSLSQVSQLFAQGSVGRGRRSRRSRLPGWACKLIRALPYTVLITFSAGALLIGIVSFALFISASIG